MPITVQCPNPACGVMSPANEAINGRTVRCKKCGQPFVARPTLDGQQSTTKQSQPSSPSNPFPLLPAEFGRYRVLQLLGKGGMGAVYLAQDTQLKRQVALKMLYVGASDSPQRVERFVREAQSAAVLQHPNICTVFDAGQIEGRPFLTMMYIAGKSLEDEIDPDAPLPQIRAAEIARKIALALDHAHGKGIVHRDLKPANVMITAEGEPVVMDFGLAKRVADREPNEAKLTRDGGILGTPSYMSPEQVRGEIEAIGPATDIYSLGVMLFEMLTGNPPYNGAVGVVMAQILHAPVPPVREFRPDADVRLDAICHWAMAKDPASRLPSMASLAKALGEYLKTPHASPPSPPLPVPPQVPVAVTVLPSLPPLTTQSPFENLQDPAPPIRTPVQTPYAARRRSKSRVAMALIGLFVLSGLIAVAAVFITVRTKQGEVLIELNDAKANVAVQVDGERIDVMGLDKPLTLTVGEHDLTVTGPDFETATRSFLVKKSETQILKITLKPKEMRASKELTNPPAVKVETKPGDGIPNSIKEDTNLPTVKVETKPGNGIPNSIKEDTNPPTVKVETKPGDGIPNSIKEDTNPPAVKVETKQREGITNSIGMKLAYIPPGTFSMGSPKDEKERSEDEEQHEVEITKGFYLGVYEVTQEEYEKLMGKNPSYFSAKGGGKANVAGVNTSRFPVEKVSYDDAVKFCAKLSEMPEEKQRKRRYRLPTEAEWEYACRGGAVSNAPFHFGKSLSSNLANFDGNYPYGGTDKGTYLKRTCTVGSFKPNGFGLYDMHGNVSEWCSDRYGNDYYGRSPNRDPLGPFQGSSHVNRGGNWYVGGRSCRSATRSYNGPTGRGYDLGFRVALAASGQE